MVSGVPCEIESGKGEVRTHDISVGEFENLDCLAWDGRS